jgi:hypothetical protein
MAEEHDDGHDEVDRGPAETRPHHDTRDPPREDAAGRRVDALREGAQGSGARPAARRARPLRSLEWLLGALLASSALALVVVFLGEGFPAAEPASRAAPLEQGGDEQAAVVSLIDEHAAELQACLDRWASSAEPEPGTIVLALIEATVGDGGIPSAVEVTGEGLAESFGRFLQRAVGLWRFPGERRQLAFEIPFEVSAGRSAGRGEPDAGPAADEVSPQTE